MEDKDIIQQAYLKRKLPQDVKSLPYDEMSIEEQRIIDKVNNSEELTDEELTIIKKAIGEYHEILKKYDVNEIIESNVVLNDSLATEQELLDMVYNREMPVIKMKMPHIKDNDGNPKVFEFHVKPLEDSRAVTMLETHLDIFKDLSDEERKIYEKDGSGQSLNPKEEKVLKHIQEKIAENQSRSQMKEVSTFLAYQVEEPSSLSLDDKKKFWLNFDFLPKMLLYSRVMNAVGLDNQSNEDLFLD